MITKAYVKGVKQNKKSTKISFNYSLRVTGHKDGPYLKCKQIKPVHEHVLQFYTNHTNKRTFSKQLKA